MAVMGAVVFLFAGALAPVAVSSLSSAIGGPTMIGTALALVCAAANVFGAAMFAFARHCFARSTGFAAAVSGSNER